MTRFGLSVSFMVLILLGVGGFLLFKKHVGTVNIPGDASTEVGQGNEEESSTEVRSLPGFNLPEGFTLNIFAKDLPGARVMAFDDTGDMWVSQTSKGKIVKLDANKNPVTVLGDLNNPHGIVFDTSGNLYFAEENKISVLRKGESEPEKIADLPTTGGGHYTRTLGIGPDERLYVSIGSSCNVCNEDDPRRAAIYSMKTDGTDFKQFAKGLRNAVFFTWNPVDGKMWGTDMGRDNLGDDLPPDEINIIEQKNGEPQNYGWPICYGKNIHDTQFDKNTYIRNPCMEPFEKESFVDLQAHSAPLGLAFVPEEGWPEDWWYDLLVAYHGSWNRSTPTGYKIVRLKMNAKGEYLGTEDFITGWLTSDGKKLGRPVDIKVFSGGTAYISDDDAGVIYRLSRK